MEPSSIPYYHPLSGFKGLSSQDGRAVSGEDHLRASIQDILTTPIGSAVMRRTYGSRLFSLIDRPFGPGLVAEIVAATAEAIEIWEPRVDVKRVLVKAGGAGRASVDVVIALAGKRVLLEDVA
jgi:uncharacterized protein